MATEVFKKTMEMLKTDYKDFQREEKEIIFSFKDYVEAYLKSLDYEDNDYNDDDDDSETDYTEEDVEEDVEEEIPVKIKKVTTPKVEMSKESTEELERRLIDMEAKLNKKK